MKKKILPALILSQLSLVLFAQKNSEDGYFVPTEGTLRVLVVYAQVDYSIGGCPAPGDTYGSNGDWADGQAPYWETGGGPYINPQPLFDADLPITDGTLTDYYFQASRGELTALGDYINLVIPCTTSGLSGDGLAAVFTTLDAMGSQVTTAHGKHLADFDLFNGNGKGLVKSVGTDGKIDCVFVIWKNNSYTGNIDCSSGYGVNGYYSYQINDQGSTWSFPVISSWGGCSWDGTYYTFTAEFLHGLLGSNNWHTGGGAGPYTFLVPPHTLCTTAQYDNQSNMFCGWDRNHLGWKGSKTNLISAHNCTTGSEVMTDLTEPTSAGPFEATYCLQDFALTGDAIRIKLPHINYTGASSGSGAVKNQYLWLENHQKISGFDHAHYEEHPDLPQATGWKPGLFSYIQVGKDFKTDQPPLNDVFVDSYGLYPEDPNCLGSWIMPITAEGNYDFKYRTDKTDLWCGFGNGKCTGVRIPVDKSQSIGNPLTGCSDIFNFFDYNVNNDIDCIVSYDGKIVSPSDQCDVYRGEVINNTFVCSMQGYGDEDDTWSIEQGKTKIGMSTNPAAVPVLTLKSHSIDYPSNIGQPIAFEDWENRIIHLNGLSIEIIDETLNYNLPPRHEDMSTPVDLKIKIRWDDYDIVDDVRWCAPAIELHPSVHYVSGPLDNPSEYSLNIKTGNSATLDRGLSPTQHVAFDTDPVTGAYRFTQPTVMTCDANSYFHIENNADLYIRNGSTLELMNGSKLELGSGARVHVENGSTLKIDDGAELKIFQGGYVEVEEGGTLIVENVTDATKGIQFGGGNPNAKVVIRGNLVYSNGADMEHHGNGYYHFAGNGKLTLNSGSVINLVGNNINEKMLEMEAQVTVDGYAATLSTGKIEVHNDSWLKIKNGSVSVSNVNVAGVNIPAVNSKGLVIEQPVTSCSITGSTFINLATGTELIKIKNPVAGNLSTLTYSGCKTGIKCSNSNTVNVINSSIIESLSPGSVGTLVTGTTNFVLDNTLVKWYDTGASLSSTRGFYMTNGAQIFDINKGIYGDASKVWLRFGARVVQCYGRGIELHGSWSDLTGNYTSMLTMGDNGCGSVYDCYDECISGDNFLMNIDPVLHDAAEPNPDGLYNPNHIAMVSTGANYLFNVCYTNESPTPHAPHLVYARKNIWAPNGSTSNQNPDLTKKKIGSTTGASCFTQNNIPLAYLSISACYPQVSPPLCSWCYNNGKLEDEETDSLTITVANIVTEAYRDANEEFLEIDNDSTRNEFTGLSVLGLEYDSVEQNWEITTTAGVVLPADDSTAHRIMVAKVLKEIADSSGSERLSSSFAPDIFAPFYTELLSPHSSSELPGSPGMVVYPNPAENKVNIFFKQSTNEKDVVLSNLLGRELKSLRMVERGEMDLLNLPKGMYILKAIDKKDQTMEVVYLAVQ
ncbi:MAG: T9SS type A sorting domain-containing protein [Bacteroidetes bacterium]|nr:T9SS type A sorting domain-containing protein [Bacteroidota bacterium]